MKVIICGAGRVGQGIARRLSREGHDISIVDENGELVEQISTDLDVQGVVGNGAHPSTLRSAKANESEMVIAVTQHDEVNMVICQVAKTIFKTPNTIARIRSRDYRAAQWKDLFSGDGFPITMTFSPEELVGDAIFQRFKTQGAVMSASFAKGRVQLLGIDMEEDSPLLGTMLDQIEGLFPDLSARVVGLGKGGRIQAPRSNDALQPGERAYIAVLNEHVDRLNAIFDNEEKEARLVTIVGAGNVGLYVAERLSRERNVRVRLVERDKARANTAVAKLSRTVVIHGDGLDRDVIEEAGGSRTDLLIAITNDDQTNLLTCGLAKKAGARRTMALVNEPHLGTLRRDLKIDAIIDPRALTVSKILTKFRRGRITALRSLEDGKAEVVEGITLETSSLIGRSLGYDDMPDGIAAVCVLRGDEVIFPSPKVEVEVGDHVTLLFEEERVREVEQFFRVSAGFF